jgi:hypothetical protein
MNRKTIKQYALTHAQAYAFELAQELFNQTTKAFSDNIKKEATKLAKNGYWPDEPASDLDYARALTTLTDTAKNIDELTHAFACGCNKDDNWQLRIQEFTDRLQNFYDAMVKVIEHSHKDTSKHEEGGYQGVTEHGGTECRGWWRVFDAIKGDNYFSAFDLGRDMGMAEEFYDAGAITEAQYRAHIVRRTLKMMANKRFVNEKGLPDYEALTTYLKPEYNDVYLDMNLVNAVKDVA